MSELPGLRRCYTISMVTKPAIVHGRIVRGPCSNNTVPPSYSTCFERSHPPNRSDCSYTVIGTPGANLVRYHAVDKPVIPPPVKIQQLAPATAFQESEE